VEPGVRLVTTPGFPVVYKAEVERAALLDLLRQKKDLNWTFLSLSALLWPASGPASSASGATSF
jgi:uncharacterized protein